MFRLNREAFRKGGPSLALFAALCAGIIATTRIATFDAIESGRAMAKEAVLDELLAATNWQEPTLLDTRADNAAEVQFIVSEYGHHVGFIIVTETYQGYNGLIRLAIALKNEGEIEAIRVIEHNETPGLGDKIEHRKSLWIEQFSGKSLANTSSSFWQVKKDGGKVDQFSGATITPRAVVKAIHTSLKAFKNDKNAVTEENKFIDEPLKKNEAE